MNSSYFSTPPVVKNLIIINCLAFLGVWLIPSLNQFMGQYGVLYWFGSPYYHSYQFVTYMFLHASLEHLFFNMFALWMFGRTLEYALGSKRFLIYYMVCGVGAALVQMGVAGLTDEFGIQLLGASGAVMGLLLAFGVLWPNSIIMLLIPPIPLKAKWFVIIYAAIELLLGWTGRDPGVAHFCPYRRYAVGTGTALLLAPQGNHPFLIRSHGALGIRFRQRPSRPAARPLRLAARRGIRGGDGAGWRCCCSFMYLAPYVSPDASWVFPCWGSSRR